MKANQFRAMMLVLLMAVVSLGRVNGQTLTVTGVVTSAEDGTPIVGCTVRIEGSRKATSTNISGEYSIQANKGQTLLFNFIGYKQEKRVVASSKLNVAMKTDNAPLSESVVVCFGTGRTKAVVGTGAYMAICPRPAYDMSENTEEYGQIQENGFKNVTDAPLSTFSIDVDAASYSNMRRFINKGELPPDRKSVV